MQVILNAIYLFFFKFLFSSKNVNNGVARSVIFIGTLFVRFALFSLLRFAFIKNIKLSEICSTFHQYLITFHWENRDNLIFKTVLFLLKIWSPCWKKYTQRGRYSLNFEYNSLNTREYTCKNFCMWIPLDIFFKKGAVENCWNKLVNFVFSKTKIILKLLN